MQSPSSPPEQASNAESVVQRSPGLADRVGLPWVRAITNPSTLKGLCKAFDDSRTHRGVDRVIWAGLGRRPNPGTDTPTSVVEFDTIGRRNRERDYVEKRREYDAAGVREYWVIDRFQRIMTTYGRHVSPSGERVVAEHEVYSTEVLPGFELPLKVLFETADEWK